MVITSSPSKNRNRSKKVAKSIDCTSALRNKLKPEKRFSLLTNEYTKNIVAFEKRAQDALQSSKARKSANFVMRNQGLNGTMALPKTQKDLALWENLGNARTRMTEQDRISTKEIVESISIRTSLRN